MMLTTLLVFGFLIKILSRRPLYTYIKEKFGIETLVTVGVAVDVRSFDTTL